MSKIIIFGGTTEGRELSQWLSSRREKHIVSVATPYGERTLDESYANAPYKNNFADIHEGRMDFPKMREFIKSSAAEVVVDATHPFADKARENIERAAKEAGARHIRLSRRDGFDEADKINGGAAPKKRYFKTHEECIGALEKTSGNILLTTGSKELFKYAAKLKGRIVVRVLPGWDSIAECKRCGIPGKNIIAMQGPFSAEMNIAVIHSYDIKILVTKQSGAAGGFPQKEEAAASEGIPMYILERTKDSDGMAFSRVCECLEEYFTNKKINISIIGAGMGNKSGMTVRASEALLAADIVFGAKRLLESLEIKQESYPYYLEKDILPILIKKRRDAAVLFSGDAGFYSGAKKLYEALKKETEKGVLNADIDIFPGISSISALAALFKIPWEDAEIISTHGKGDISNWGSALLSAVRANYKVFTLLSGLNDLKSLMALLAKNFMTDCRILAGYQMHLKECELLKISPLEADRINKEGLYSIFIINEHFVPPALMHGLPDREFIRDKVPMTKEEVREVSVSKLRLSRNSILYDIGSGTGSIAVEAARLSPAILVYALERKPEAAELIHKNKKKFRLANINIVLAQAPNKLKELPRATHAFIGGSGGHMFEILDELFTINPKMRVVINAVSLETLQEITRIEERLKVKDFEIVSLQASRMNRVGKYSMMKAENPVWICSFEGDDS